MRHLETRDWLIFGLCIAIIGMTFFFSWGNFADAPPFLFAINFNEPLDFLFSLVIAAPVLIIILTLTDLRLRPAFIFLAAIATLASFVWFAGNLAYTSLTSEFVLGGDRLWLVKILSIPFWIHFTLAIVLLILAGLGLMDKPIEAGDPEIQSV